jgi:hypothetical protein
MSILFVAEPDEAGQLLQHKRVDGIGCKQKELGDPAD